MTPAVQLLKKAKAEFELLEYKADPKLGNFGQASAEKLGLPEAQVFKTLLANDDSQPRNMVVAVVPVSAQLDLKKLAKAAGIKKMSMCELNLAERTTGYVKGGISPLGQKRLLPTFIDDSAEQFAQIYVSAGKRGLSVGLNAQLLASITKGQFTSLSTSA
ncbi:Cys-tRNA(Pro) deacylase [Aliagarivorans taiwanensis]|uniref:Cys-tRNA(Pro) deacylase n=1 Tax=Aliagarivorans taiwanensis TaxID=561966 RepID=UPI0003FF7BEA|nr:Cys-tRNA(Pro) deacylase [Aliagarivorans taiwanensis]